MPSLRRIEACLLSSIQLRVYTTKLYSECQAEATCSIPKPQGPRWVGLHLVQSSPAVWGDTQLKRCQRLLRLAVFPIIYSNLSPAM